jgi:SOS-response transcriptional repressor LexA
MKRPNGSTLSPAQKADQQRLKKLVDGAPLGIQALVAADLEVSPSAVTQQVIGHRPLNLRYAVAFSRRLGVQLSDISPTLAAEASSLSANAEPASLQLRRIPLISFVQAGTWMEATDSYEPGAGSEWIATGKPVSSSAFALRIKGDSMHPDFRDGDVVIVDPVKQPTPGCFVVAKNGSNDATFKKYRPRGRNEQGREAFELVPLNPDYPSMHSDREQISIIGVAVEHHRSL